MSISPDTPAPPVQVDGEGELRATIKTSKGEMTVRLFEKEVPRTVANFVALAQGSVEWTAPTGEKTSKPLYDGTIIHRVIPGFMIQMGCPKGNGTGGPGWRFGDEIDRSLRHDKAGILSMANAGPGTNGSQFFITEDATPHLNDKHAVFGELIDGMDVLHAIATAPRDGRDRPREDIVVETIAVHRA